MARVKGLLFFLLFLSGCCTCAPPAEQRAAKYFDSIRQQPSLRLGFLRDMPKGGDLHSHLSGAIYAESFIGYAAKDGKCVDRATLSVGPCTLVKGKTPACGSGASQPVSCAYKDQNFYNAMLDAWSMHNWNPAKESGHDHFFATFGKFGAATDGHTADMVAEAMRRAAADHVQYLELMNTLDGSLAKDLGTKVGWDDDLAAMRGRLLAQGMSQIVETTRKTLTSDESDAKSLLKCSTPDPDPGCSVTVRYLYQVGRGRPKEQVFAQILLGFELAQADSRVVGLNLVMPEDAFVPMQDFHLHMKILDYLHGVYPNVHITLHAGELAKGLVPPEDLRYHIRESVELGHAERIGHGVDVMNENNAQQLLEEMARRNVLVEICLTSNDVILGVKGNEHPLPMYRKNGVPVTLATDDQGVSRSDMTQEYVRAATTYNLSYADLKQMARQSLEHSFLPGDSLWTEIKEARRVSQCSGDASDAASSACGRFLATSERARAEWKLEENFSKFEKRF